MRRRMQELAAGIFESEGPKISLSHERLELVFEEEHPLKGTFEIDSLNHVNMRGIVYSDNPRMEIREPEFHGVHAVIEYEFHTEGLVEGDIQKGEFFIICNKNEYSLSFVVSATPTIVMINDTEIDSLEAFTQLAKKDEKKAYEFFTSPSFGTCLHKESIETKLMARIFSYEGAPYHNLEEFLVSTNYKEEAKLFSDFQGGVYENVTENIREVIEITRKTWGHTPLYISTDASFISFQKKMYDGNDFIGNSCRIPFYIEPENMHAGKNLGCITVISGKNCLSFSVEASKKVLYEERREVKNDYRNSVFLLTRDYVDFRIGKIMPSTWSLNTIQMLDHLLARRKDDKMLWLAKAQALVMGGRNQEAQWVLDQNKDCLNNSNSREYAYFMYITTFLNPERAYLRKVNAVLQNIYPRIEKDDLMFWILLFLSETYENSKSRKYQVIKNYCMHYSTSPIFYAECWQLVKEQPELLDEFGLFEERLIYWIYRKELITKEFAEYIVETILHSRTYWPKLTRVLKYCYETWEQDEMLNALCCYLIKGNQYGKEEYKWYSVALEKQLRITGLYEAYIVSATAAKQTIFPKMVQYYFQYKSNLSYRYKAVVYDGIIQNREKQTSLYLNCKPEMEQFALEQIRAGHIDENLARIYELYLKSITLTHELSRSLAPILYIHKLTCDNPNMKQVVVTHYQVVKTMTYPIIQGEAYFPLYSKEYVIALEDGNGQRYGKSISYDLIRLMQTDNLTKRCIKVAPEQMPYLIHYFDNRGVGKAMLSELTDVELGYLEVLLSSDAITDSFKKKLRPSLIDFYHQSENTQSLDDYLKDLDFSGLSQETRMKACELLIERGFYEKAYVTIVSYGCHQISASLLLTLCTRLIERKEYEADDFLIGLCSLVFKRGKFNETLLIYLEKYMYGATKKLYELWLAARDFQVNVFQLEERLLVQMLYTENFVKDSEEVLKSYIEAGGKKLVLDAYVSYFAYEYFVKGAYANQLVMEQIEGEERKGYSLSLLKKLTLLKWFCETHSTRYDVMTFIYDELVERGLTFGFFDALPKEVTVHYPRYGKYVIEYRTRKKETVYIRYLSTDYYQEQSTEEEFVAEQLPEVFEGIYAKEFTLFYGDSVQYYICEGKNDASNVTFSGQITNTEISKNKSNSRYELINSLIIAEQLGEHKAVEEKTVWYDEWLKHAKKELQWIK